MKSLFAAAATVAVVTLFAISPAAAAECAWLSPVGGQGTTNIHTGPSLDAPVADAVISTGRRTLKFCGQVRLDTNGHFRDATGETIRWLRVSYHIQNDDNWHYGWVSEVVIGVAVGGIPLSVSQMLDASDD